MILVAHETPAVHKPITGSKRSERAAGGNIQVAVCALRSQQRTVRVCSWLSNGESCSGKCGVGVGCLLSEGPSILSGAKNHTLDSIRDQRPKTLGTWTFWACERRRVTQLS